MIRKLLLVALPIAVLAACGESGPSDVTVPKSPREVDVASLLARPTPQISKERLQTHLETMFQAAMARRSELDARGLNLAPPKAADIVVPDDYPTIQEAIDNAAPGSTILVKPGYYVEPGGNTILTPDLTLIGHGATQFGGFGLFAENLRLEGFKILFDDFAGIIVYGPFGVPLTGNVVTQNTVSGPDYVAQCGPGVCELGILVQNATGTMVDRNKVTGTGWGVVAYATDDVTLDRNTVTASAYSSGMEVSNSANTVVTNNVLTADQDGIAFYNSDGSTVSNNTVDQSGYGGIYALSLTNATISNNTISTPAFHGIQIWSSTDNRVGNNTLAGAQVFGLLAVFSDRNLLDHNKVTGTGYTGAYLIYSNQNQLVNSVVSDGAERGVLVEQGDGNYVANNAVNNNVGGPGIALSDASDNTIERNSAFGNGVCDLVETGSSANNTYIKNKVGCASIP